MLFVPILLSLFISVATAIVIQQLFFKINKVDPINHRSSHTAKATRSGGISIFAALFGTSLYLYFTEQQLFDFSLLVPLSIMFFTGLYDDFYNADFKLKFFIQIIVAKILIDQGLLIDNYHGLFGLYEIPRLMAQLSTVFVFLVVVNSINFIDGIDGLAITEIIKIILIIEFFSNSFTVLAHLGFLIIVSILPLYYFNFKKENKVFLGDSGSLLLGTFIMIYILNVLNSSYDFDNRLQINKVLFSIILLIYPLIDLLRVFIIRIYLGRSPFQADKNHIHHKLNNLTNNNFLSTIIILSIEISVLYVFI